MASKSCHQNYSKDLTDHATPLTLERRRKANLQGKAGKKNDKEETTRTKRKGVELREGEGGRQDDEGGGGRLLLLRLMLSLYGQ